VGLGYYALYDNTTGNNNIGVGYAAFQNISTGYSNIGVGSAAGNNATTAIGNTCVGVEAGHDLTSGQNNLFLGNSAGRSSSPSGTITTSSNIVVLGNDNITTLMCADTSISASDSRDKTDITDFTKGLDWINALRPVTYRWDKRSWYGTDSDPYGTPDGSKKANKLNIGFLAQEVNDVEKANGYGDDNDNMLVCHLTEDKMRFGIKYERLVPVLVNAIKELSAKVTALEAA